MPAPNAKVKEEVIDSGSRSSPWAQSKAGGALSPSALDFNDEPTVAEIPSMSPFRRPAAAEAQPQIAKVGFTGGPPQKANALHEAPRPPANRALSDERSDTDEMSPEDILKKRNDQPWEEVIEAAASAQEKYGAPRAPTRESPRAKVQPPVQTRDLIKAKPKAPADPASTPPPDSRPDELLANRPVNASALPPDARRKDGFARLADLETPAVPPTFGSPVRRPDFPRDGSAPHEATRLAGPGELAGKPDGAAAKAQLRAAGDMGRTVAAPGELAGLVADLSQKPMAVVVKPPPSAKLPPPSPQDLLRPAALAQPLDASLPMRVKTESDRGGNFLPEPTDPDEGMASMPGAAIPLSKTPAHSPPLKTDLLEGAVIGFDVQPTIEPSLKLEVASAPKRWAALLIDGAVTAVPILIPMMLGIFGPAFRAISYVDPDDVSGLLISGAYKKPLIAYAVVMIVFSAVSHALAGRTVGKLAMGLEVVSTKTGERPRPVRAVLRALFSLLSLALMGSGYLWLIIDRRSRAIHDWLAGTAVVVSRSRARAG